MFWYYLIYPTIFFFSFAKYILLYSYEKRRFHFLGFNNVWFVWRGLTGFKLYFCRSIKVCYVLILETGVTQFLFKTCGRDFRPNNFTMRLRDYYIKANTSYMSNNSIICSSALYDILSKTFLLQLTEFVTPSEEYGRRYSSRLNSN